MQRYNIEGYLETLEVLNTKTCIIKKNNKIYIRLDDATGKGMPGDWSYSEYFPVYKAAKDYAKELADKTDVIFYIYLRRDTDMYYVIPITNRCYYKYEENSKYISQIYPEKKLYLFKIHHHSYRTGQKYSTEVGIMKARNLEEAKEKIWKEYGTNNTSFHDDEIKEIPKEEDTRTFGVLIQGS